MTVMLAVVTAYIEVNGFRAAREGVMHHILKFVRLSIVVSGLALAAGCGDRPQISYYLIHPAAGERAVPEAEETIIKAVLDKVAGTYQLAKAKPSDEGIIRYYQPNQSLFIAFYAKRSEGKIAVHLRPLTRGFETREYYQQFHKSLVAALAQNFPGRIATMTEP